MNSTNGQIAISAYLSIAVDSGVDQTSAMEDEVWLRNVTVSVLAAFAAKVVRNECNTLCILWIDDSRKKKPSTPKGMATTNAKVAVVMRTSNDEGNVVTVVLVSSSTVAEFLLLRGTEFCAPLLR